MPMTQTRILYIEDNDDLRDSITMVLEDEPSYDVTVCTSGEEGLEQLTRTGCDILITDVGLPGLSGVELARLALQRNPQQWVVLCSGYDTGGTIASLGPNVRALTKPFELDDLERMLKDIAGSVRSPGG
jgi:CheY-like chemotaxis protein